MQHRNKLFGIALILSLFGGLGAGWLGHKIFIESERQMIVEVTPPTVPPGQPAAQMPEQKTTFAIDEQPEQMAAPSDAPVEKAITITGGMLLDILEEQKQKNQKTDLEKRMRDNGISCNIFLSQQECEGFLDKVESSQPLQKAIQLAGKFGIDVRGWHEFSTSVHTIYVDVRATPEEMIRRLLGDQLSQPSPQD